MRNKRQKSLNKKLTSRLLAVGLIPMLCISIFQYYFSTNLLIQQEQEAIQISTNSVATGMDEWLQGKFEEVVLASQSAEIIGLNQQEQLNMAKKLKQLDEAYEAVVFIDTEGIVRAHTTEKQINNQSLWERPYFQQGLKGETTITEVLVSNVSGNRMITLSTPVYNEQKIVGVFIATVNFGRLSEKYLQQNEVGKTYVLIDSKGVIQAHPDESLINVPLAEANLHATWSEFFATPVEESAVVEMNVDGETSYVASTRLNVPGYSLHTIVEEESVVSAVKPLQYAGSVLILITAIIVLILGVYLARSISRPIVRTTEQVDAIAQGDLLVEPLTIDSDDEVGRLQENVNAMQTQLSSIIRKVNGQSISVASSASELEMAADQANDATARITQTVEMFATGAEKQMQHVEQTAEATTNLTERVNTIAIEAATTSSLSQEALQKAADGNEKIQLTVAQMESIFATMKALSESMQQMEQRSTEIDKIVDVISSIAAQTNLLSLNASIEAARAGEHGKGFAVVANEVRSLAEQSSHSAQQINELISNIQKATIEAVRMMEKGQKEVERGVDVAYDAGKLFSEIREELEVVTNKTIEVSKFADVMESSTDEVSASMCDIMKVSQETLHGTQEVIAQIEEQMASIEEITNATHTLSDMADELNAIVNEFKVVK